MAYVTTVNKACVNRDVAVEEIHTQLEAMGWRYVDGMFTSYSVNGLDVATNIFYLYGHGYTDGQCVCFSTLGTLPAPITSTSKYYLKIIDESYFTISITYNGADVNITGSLDNTYPTYVREASRIYVSEGEYNDRVPEYLEVSTYKSPTAIHFIVSYYYNITTHTLYGMAANYGLISTSESGFYLWIHGNKNLVAIHSKISTTYYKCFFGHMSRRYIELITYLTEDYDTYYPGRLKVSSTDGFEVGINYQIIGISGEGRDTVFVQSIDSATQMTLVSMPRTYTAGAFIGVTPSTFCVQVNANAYTCDPHLTEELDSIGIYGFGSISSFIGNTGVSPNSRINRYMLQPIAVHNVYSKGSTQFDFGFYNDEYILYSTGSPTVNEDTIGVNKIEPLGYANGTPLYNTASSGSETTLVDTGKAWTVNQFVDKVVITTFGLGAGMIKKIGSNTADTITLASGYAFETVPNSTTQYIICDEGYRNFITSIPAACREGV